MANPGIIIPYLSRYFNVPTPRWVVGASLPKNILGLYDADTMTIYFRDVDPGIDVITHEFGHHLHTVYGVKASRLGYEAIANRIEKALTEFYGGEPHVYSMSVLNNYNWVTVLIGLAIMFIGFMK